MWHRTITYNVENWEKVIPKANEFIYGITITVAATANIDSDNLTMNKYTPYTYETTLKHLLTNVLKNVDGIFICSMCRGYNKISRPDFRKPPFDSDGGPIRLFGRGESQKKGKDRCLYPWLRGCMDRHTRDTRTDIYYIL